MDRRTVLKGGLVLAATAHTAVASGDLRPTSPQDRIAAAMKEIEAAMQEMHPGWRIQVKDDVVCPLKYVLGGPDEKQAPHRHAVAIYATAETIGREEFRWFVDYV